MRFERAVKQFRSRIFSQFNCSKEQLRRYPTRGVLQGSVAIQRLSDNFKYMAHPMKFLFSLVGAALAVFLFALLFKPAAGFEPSQSFDQTPPPLGWSSWSSTWTIDRLNSTYVKSQADVMFNKLRAFGYTYINLDYGWSKGYDEHGRPAVNTDKFPGGLRVLAQYLHSKGLKLGIYLLPGVNMDAWKANGTVEGTSYHLKDITDPTQQGNTEGHGYKIDYTKPGAKEFVQGYANLLASWGVDYIKMDFVGPGGGNNKADTRDDLRQWHESILRTRRPIWLELSNSLSIDNVRQRFDDSPYWAKFAAPGNWNDLDSLEVGQGDADGLTPDERKTAMTLWAISCSPLFLGSDLTQLNDYDLSLLTNPEVLKVNQAGHVAVPLSQKTSQQVWSVENPDGSVVVALFNLADTPATVAVALKDLNLTESAIARDLWTHTNLGTINSQYEVLLPPHACQLLMMQ